MVCGGWSVCGVQHMYMHVACSVVCGHVCICNVPCAWAVTHVVLYGGGTDVACHMWRCPGYVPRPVQSSVSRVVCHMCAVCIMACYV